MDREIILRRTCLKCVDYSRQITYHREMLPYVDKLKVNYWIYTFNNFIDMAVLDWCHLFGNHDDDLHWRNVVADKNIFKNRLLQSLEIEEGQWQEYWTIMKDYRDKDVAHLEVRPSTVVPDMDIGILSVGFYYNWIIPELKAYGRYDLYLHNLFDYFHRMHQNTEKFISEHLHELFDLRVVAD